jgi:hypothetical protein
MRQKYLISRNYQGKELKIVEYAVLDKDLKKVASEQLRNDNFSLLCKETYKSENIVNSISRGKEALVETLRTHNIFPISPYAIKIAEAVKELYSLSEDGTAELFFDDVDLVSN